MIFQLEPSFAAMVFFIENLNGLDYFSLAALTFFTFMLLCCSLRKHNPHLPQVGNSDQQYLPCKAGIQPDMENMLEDCFQELPL